MPHNLYIYRRAPRPSTHENGDYILVLPEDIDSPASLHYVSRSALRVPQIEQLGLCLHTGKEYWRVDRDNYAKMLQQISCVNDKKAPLLLSDEHIQELLFSLDSRADYAFRLAYSSFKGSFTQSLAQDNTASKKDEEANKETNECKIECSIN